MDCQNHSSDRAGEDGARASRSPCEAERSAAVLPGMSQKRPEASPAGAAGILRALSLTQMCLLRFCGVLSGFSHSQLTSIKAACRREASRIG